MTSILITGGAGFIGSNLVRHLLETTTWDVVVVDALTYAGNLRNLEGLHHTGRLHFVHGSIANPDVVEGVITRYTPDAVINCAAETHVDRSIQSARPFVDANVVGATVLVEQVRRHGVGRLVHVSTDEVYGSLSPSDRPFRADDPLRPSSAYAASKAASDLMVLADVHTHGTDAVVTRCTNNYGPYQFPEKLIPLMTLNAMEGKPLPVYGEGRNVRDWIHVTDHCRAVLAVLHGGIKGGVYLFGGNTERTNLEVVQAIIGLVGASMDLIEFVKDRPGHDYRYAVDNTVSTSLLGWTPTVPFDEGLRDTVEWYQTHPEWTQSVRDGSYKEFYAAQYGKHLE